MRNIFSDTDLFKLHKIMQTIFPAHVWMWISICHPQILHLSPICLLQMKNAGFLLWASLNEEWWHTPAHSEIFTCFSNRIFSLQRLLLTHWQFYICGCHLFLNPCDPFQWAQQKRKFCTLMNSEGFAESSCSEWLRSTQRTGLNCRVAVNSSSRLKSSYWCCKWARSTVHLSKKQCEVWRWSDKSRLVHKLQNAFEWSLRFW